MELPKPDPKPVVVVDYDPEWPLLFQRLAERARAVLGDLALRIEHVGSTSVPGLRAKPIVDMDTVIASRDQLPEVIARLAAVGYEHRGDLDVTDREAFREPPHLPRHNFYVCPINGRELPRHLAFRDALRADPALRSAYAALKTELAARYPFDIDGYCEAKTDFIVGVLRRAGVAD